MTKHCRNHRIHWQKKIDFSYLDPKDTLESKRNDLKPSFSRKKSFAFQKKEGKSCRPEQTTTTACVSRTIHDLSVWNKPLIDTCQYCSTSRANQSLRLLANAGFQNRGVCLQAFPSFPSPSPLFHFLALGLSLLQNQAKWKRLPRRLFLL